jgi:hypothetical protein
MFESGTLAKSLDDARLVPLCIDLRPSDITGPLAAFQARGLQESDIKRLVQDLNGAVEKPMAIDRVDRSFGRVWPELASEIAKAFSRVNVDLAELHGEPERQEKDMLAELVDAVRRIERQGRSTVSTYPQSRIGDGQSSDDVPDVVYGPRNLPRPSVGNPYPNYGQEAKGGVAVLAGPAFDTVGESSIGLMVANGASSGRSHDCDPLAGRRSTDLTHHWRPSAPRTRPHHSRRSLTHSRAGQPWSTWPPPPGSADRLLGDLLRQAAAARLWRGDGAASPSRASAEGSAPIMLRTEVSANTSAATQRRRRNRWKCRSSIRMGPFSAISRMPRPLLGALRRTE